MLPCCFILRMLHHLYDLCTVHIRRDTQVLRPSIGTTGERVWDIMSCPSNVATAAACNLSYSSAWTCGTTVWLVDIRVGANTTLWPLLMGMLERLHLC